MSFDPFDSEQLNLWNAASGISQSARRFLTTPRRARTPPPEYCGISNGDLHRNGRNYTYVSTCNPTERTLIRTSQKESERTPCNHMNYVSFSADRGSCVRPRPLLSKNRSLSKVKEIKSVSCVICISEDGWKQKIVY